MFSGKGSLTVPFKLGMMSEASATLAYLGPDVDDGSMDVADLAPALLAASRLITSANRALNGDRADVRVRVAALRTGSFEIELQVVTSLWEQTKALLSQDDIQAAKELLDWIFGLIGAGAAVSLLSLVRFLRGRRIRRLARRGELVVIFVETEGGEETIEVSEPVAKLATDEAVRRSLTDLTAPLSKEGITALEVREGERVIERVTKAESEAFAEAPTADRPLVADTREQSFEIVSLAFREENKWRLSDGNSTISVMIEDRDFLEQVNRSAISFPSTTCSDAASGSNRSRLFPVFGPSTPSRKFSSTFPRRGHYLCRSAARLRDFTRGGYASPPCAFAFIPVSGSFLTP